MSKHLLNDKTILNAKPGAKDYRLNDGEGLSVLVKTSGAKWWRFDYSIDSKRKTLSLGVYPVTRLADARRKTEDARIQISKGIDPSNTRKEVKASKQLAAENTKRVNDGLPILNSFEDVACKWLASTTHTVRDITYKNKIRRFEMYVFPIIGPMGINEIKSLDIYRLVKPLFTKLETVHRIHTDISSVYDYAIAHGLTDYDPAQAVGAQIPAKKVKHRAALTDPKDVALLLRDIGNYQGTFTVQCAFRLSPLLFQRPGEIRQMEWKDIDINAREWRYFVTKTEVLHIVPLSTQAVAILEEIKPHTSSSRYVFPSCRTDNRPMSEGTILAALKALGYDSDVMTAHGFRTTASTLLNEQGWSPDAIERQLCHMPRDQVRAAYNRAQYLEERRSMMQSWADYLDGLKNGAQIIPIKARLAKPK
jgi:integrase